jgi:hypothetical protein
MTTLLKKITAERRHHIPKDQKALTDRLHPPHHGKSGLHTLKGPQTQL